MRRGFGLLWVLVTVLVAGLVGALAYQAGLATHIPAAAGAPAYAGPPYYWGWGFGLFHLFALFPLLFFVLLIFFLARGPWWHRGGGRGHLEDRLKDWHDREHGKAPAEEPRRT